MIDHLINKLIERAKRTPYETLYHADGSIYMERDWLIGGRGKDFSARLHRIHTHDLDRHMHDHPRDFISVVLRGFYIEVRPRYPNSRVFNHVGREVCDGIARTAGSIAYRRATDRHLIHYVSPDLLTLFIQLGPKRDWGFHTEDGWVHWEEYESVHAVIK